MTTFLDDKTPQAWSNCVERLLASPRYGERWGRHWMDVVRYADTAGDNADFPVPEGHIYRDYIIDAFNADKPYDQFVCEQLAGDILAKELASTNNSTEARRSSIVPQQALFALNNPFVDEQGRLLARRVLTACSDEADRVRYAHELTWSRPPTREETVKCRSWLGRARALLTTSDTPDDRREEQAWTSLARVLLMANEFMHVD